MPDGSNHRSAFDLVRVNLRKEREIVYWTQELVCTRRQLTLAVNAVGPMVSDVTEYLRKHYNPGVGFKP